MISHYSQHLDTFPKLFFCSPILFTLFVVVFWSALAAEKISSPVFPFVHVMISGRVTHPLLLPILIRRLSFRTYHRHTPLCCLSLDKKQLFLVRLDVFVGLNFY